jgi:hypothetical protein
MTTFAPHQDARRHRELDERTRHAWSAYRECLRDLSPDAYEQAEDEAWEGLQHTLRELAEERSHLSAPRAGSAPRG